MSWSRGPVMFGLASLVGLAAPGHGSLHAGAARCSPIGTHHLSRSNNQIVFAIKRTAGLLPTVEIDVYGDGRVSASGGATLAAPNRHLDYDALAGMLRLAEAERFFSLPSTNFCRTTQTDVRELTVTVRTLEAARTVSTLAVCKASSFRQLYSVLLAATGASEVP